jgi:hypothetical protein
MKKSRAGMQHNQMDDTDRSGRWRNYNQAERHSPELMNAKNDALVNPGEQGWAGLKTDGESSGVEPDCAVVGSYNKKPVKF